MDTLLAAARSTRVVLPFNLEYHIKMGMHLGVIAAKTPVAKLKAAFLTVCPQFELVDTKEDFIHSDEIWTWKAANEEFVSAADWSMDTPGKSVYLFWQDGQWTLLLDPEYTLASDEDVLRDLSLELGTVVSFVVESAGGCAFFWCFENGSLRRKICNTGGEIEIDGEPLAEESGIDPNSVSVRRTHLGPGPGDSGPGGFYWRRFCRSSRLRLATRRASSIRWVRT